MPTFLQLVKMGCFCSKESFDINGKEYQVHEKLAEGGFSMVYLAQETNSRKLFAIKKIICHSSDDEKYAFNEVDIHSQVKHGNYIMKLVDYCNVAVSGPAKSHFFLVLPYFERGTLLQELDSRGTSLRHFRPIEIYEMFLRICEGVRVLHENDRPIAHRDLKTANIALDNSGSPVLMDFGSATAARVMITTSAEAQALEDLAAERCSMPYKAPELFNVSVGSIIDERTDIWSLGCILYALCYFKSPFDAVYERGDSVALAVLSGNVSFSNQIYDQDMENLIRFLLQVDPQQRPFIQSIIERTHNLLENAKKAEII